MDTTFLAVSTLTFALFVISVILALVVKTLSSGSKRNMWLMLVVSVILLTLAELTNLATALGISTDLTLGRQLAIFFAGMALLSFFKEASEVF